jgi:hypothetical protein
MERRAIISTSLRAVGYHADILILEVEFLNGDVYQYTGVPVYEHDAMMAAESKGTYLNANIKKRYPFAKL